MKHVISIAFLSIMTCACATDPTGSTPTHRWASTHAADQIQYRNDHVRCQAQANIDNEQKLLDANSPAFNTYKQCMNNQGYVLTAYNR